MFIAALFTIAKIWKQPKRLLRGEWIKKIWRIYTDTYRGIFHSAFEKKEILSFATTWMNLKNIMLTERSQTQVTAYSMILFI